LYLRTLVKRGVYTNSGPKADSLALLLSNPNKARLCWRRDVTSGSISGGLILGRVYGETGVWIIRSVWAFISCSDNQIHYNSIALIETLKNSPFAKSILFVTLLRYDKPSKAAGSLGLALCYISLSSAHQFLGLGAKPAVSTPWQGLSG
jgi:hypothetical protein